MAPRRLIWIVLFLLDGRVARQGSVRPSAKTPFRPLMPSSPHCHPRRLLRAPCFLVLQFVFFPCHFHPLFAELVRPAKVAVNSGPQPVKRGSWGSLTDGTTIDSPQQRGDLEELQQPFHRPHLINTGHSEQTDNRSAKGCRQ